MTAVDERPGPMSRYEGSVVDEIAVLFDGIADQVAPEAAVSAVQGLVGEVIAIYRRVLDDRRGVMPVQRARLQAAGEAVASTGASVDMVAELLGQVASQLVTRIARRQPERVVPLVEVAHLLVKEFLTGSARSPMAVVPSGADRRALVEAVLSGGRIQPELAAKLEAAYVVAMLRFGVPIAPEAVLELLQKHDEAGVLSTPTSDGVVALVPRRDSADQDQLFADFTRIAGRSVWMATTERDVEDLGSAHQEVRDVLALAVATGREPGHYRVDDVLLEYAVIRDPLISARLREVIKPLLSFEALLETLECLVRNDFSRVAAAKELYVHRSTLDYRIHRIEQITGFNPMTPRGAQSLRAGIATYALSRPCAEPQSAAVVVLA